MAQVKVYGVRQFLEKNRKTLSEIIHTSLVTVLGLPSEKRFQRFFSLETDNFLFPDDRTSCYTIIEITMFEGRSKIKIKDLIYRIMNETQKKLKLHPNDVEITITQSPKYCWGIRGKTGDELGLDYKVDV